MPPPRGSRGGDVPGSAPRLRVSRKPPWDSVTATASPVFVPRDSGFAQTDTSLRQGSRQSADDFAPSDHIPGFQPAVAFAQSSGDGAGNAGDFFRPCRDWVWSGNPPLKRWAMIGHPYGTSVEHQRNQSQKRESVRPPRLKANSKPGNLQPPLLDYGPWEELAPPRFCSPSEGGGP